MVKNNKYEDLICLIVLSFCFCSFNTIAQSRKFHEKSRQSVQSEGTVVVKYRLYLVSDELKGKENEINIDPGSKLVDIYSYNKHVELRVEDDIKLLKDKFKLNNGLNWAT